MVHFHTLFWNVAAQQFGLPIPPPYTEVSKERTMDVRAGVNFAVAGARALDTDFYDKIGIIDPVTNDTLRVQLDWFKHMLPSICGPEKGKFVFLQAPSTTTKSK